MARAEEVEVKTWSGEGSDRKYGWVLTPVIKAMQSREPLLRCKECHAPVRLMSAGPGGVPAAHAEHTVGFKGCSLGDCFDGTKRPNPRSVD